MMVEQQPLSAVALGDVGRMHKHTQEQAIRIIQGVAHAPVHPFFPSKPRSPPASVGLTRWLSITPIDGSRSRSSAVRTCLRNRSLMPTKVPSSVHVSKE
jgi:hypothetical protein